MEFTYEALNKQGQPVAGKVTAENQAEAGEKLREAGVVVTKLEPIKAGGKKKKGKKVPLSDMSMFSRQLSAMLDAGIPVTQALSTLAAQTTHQSLANSVRTIAEEVEGGAALSDAFLNQRPIFTDLYCAMVAAGEIGGMLDKTLLAMSNQLHKDKQLKDAVKSATSYPKMVGGLAIIICIAMIVFMVPMFKKMTATVEDLNVVTKAIYALSDSIRANWYFYILGVVVAIFAIRFIVKSPPVQAFWEQHKMHFPLIGELINKTVLARFCRIFSTLLAGGVTAVKALETAGPTSGSKLVANAVTNAIEQIENGRTIHEALDETKMFPPMLISMVAIGEEAGTLPTMLDKVAEFYEEDVTALSKNLGSTLEPLMMMLLGGIVGFLVVALYLPVFQAATASG
ncbi:MAG: type II secretion system F family protein [Ruminococcaceae bacterium]|nr:type II secretion system F family protein [Oscillospiraceae bacterium]